VVPEIKWLSDFDAGAIDTFTSCRRVLESDYPSTFRVTKKDLWRVLTWLSELPI